MRVKLTSKYVSDILTHFNPLNYLLDNWPWINDEVCTKKKNGE